MRIAMAQMSSGQDRADNLRWMAATLDRAAGQGAELVLFPEACSYRGPLAAEHVEDRTGPTLTLLSEKAAGHGIAVLAGGLWLASGDPGRPYNASVFVGPGGEIAAEYRKVHLFRLRAAEVDEDEGAYTTPGENLVTVSYRGFVFGLSICYDLRFPELYRALARSGADVLCVPSNFSAVTGAVHWEPLLRARAIENLCYVLAPAQEGVSPDGFVTHGHSLAVDPWGRVLACAQDGTGLTVAELDRAALDQARGALNAPNETAPSVYGGQIARETARG
ncbi:carbon-nitrogen hydrolase family protein [Nonomuraea typhae]|uniref:carbon-nitrogen hydrolase family protein n=1 Tax=Nonomuraea typhae TaxID=2603600 RepID=UPI0012F9BB36|nr:carbon-nitrogen hydrolase family protein [Nonomuraea typhae]